MRFSPFVNARDLVPRFAELFARGGYSRAAFGKDCLAGLMVGVVAMPLAMAFSISAGGTPAQGLYTSIIAGFCVSAFGGSRFQIAGPTGAFVVVIFGVVAKHGMEGLFAASMLAGLMLIAMGLCGLGKFIKYIPYPVTTGFTAGIGVLIFSQQVEDFFGMAIEKSSPEFFEEWVQYIKAIPTVDIATLAVGLGAMAVIVLLRVFAPRIPGAVVGVLALTIVRVVFKLPVETIQTRFGGIPSSMAMPRLPLITWEVARDVIPDAFTIALLAAIESLLSAVVADGMTGDRHNSDGELVAQGIGNVASAIFGGIPATGAIARTATNIKSGAASPVSGIVHSVALVLFVLFLAPAASAIPLACLSAVLMIVSWDMSDIPRVIRIIRTAPKSDASVLIATFVLTIIVDLTFAVEMGVILAIFLFLRRMIEVGGIKSANSDLSVKLAREGVDNRSVDADSIRALRQHDIEVYEITGPFFFGVADMLQNTLRHISKSSKAIVLRMKDVPAIDSTGIAALESFLSQCRRRKITLILAEIHDQPKSALEKTGFMANVGEENIVSTLDEAIVQAGQRGRDG
ncbi:MAG: STAS domain-containing protein [Treponema sp.]|jgi:SulP family sulfate permease|nr:STAS domain-containing protein [Treponema sp.]